MRAALSSLSTGALLAVAVVLVIAVSAALDLQIESYALAGVLAGGVVALIPDGSAWARLGAFAVGFVAAWIGFVLRAAVLPDTDGGRAVAAVITLLICLAAVAVAAGLVRGRRLPLSAMLLGVVLFAAAYETAFAAAEPEVASTSLDAATGLVCAVAVGFAVAVLAAGRQVATSPSDTSPRHTRPSETAATGTAVAGPEVTR